MHGQVKGITGYSAWPGHRAKKEGKNKGEREREMRWGGRVILLEHNVWQTKIENHG